MINSGDCKIWTRLEQRVSICTVCVCVCMRTCVCTVGGERCVQWKSRRDQWNRLQPDHKGLERHAKELKFQLEGNGKPMQDFFFSWCDLIHIYKENFSSSVELELKGESSKVQDGFKKEIACFPKQYIIHKYWLLFDIFYGTRVKVRSPDPQTLLRPTLPPWFLWVSSCCLGPLHPGHSWLD